MHRDDATLLDIPNVARQVFLYAADMLKSSLMADDHEKQSAILCQVIALAGATNRLASEFCSRHSEIPWKEIAGMRDIFIHQYDRINLETLWDGIHQDIPQLLSFLQPLLPEGLD
jgi:uncharacterized protein with HEPN domain